MLRLKHLIVLHDLRSGGKVSQTFGAACIKDLDTRLLALETTCIITMTGVMLMNFSI